LGKWKERRKLLRIQQIMDKIGNRQILGQPGEWLKIGWEDGRREISDEQIGGGIKSKNINMRHNGKKIAQTQENAGQSERSGRRIFLLTMSFSIKIVECPNP
jgi:hypothetical protein